MMVNIYVYTVYIALYIPKYAVYSRNFLNCTVLKCRNDPFLCNIY